MIILKMLLGTLLALLGIIILLIIVFMISAYCFVNPNKVYEKENPYYRWILNFTLWLIDPFFNVKRTVVNKEIVPDEPFVLVQNHLSGMDPVVSLRVLNKVKLSFVSKPGNFRYVIYGRVIRRICFSPIDRDDARQSLEVIKRSANYIKSQGVSIGVYPEGTRNKTPENGLLPFHDGVFKIAQRANVPIVVSRISGTESFAKNWPLKRTNVKLEFLEVIPAEVIKEKRTFEIGEMVKDILENKQV